MERQNVEIEPPPHPPQPPSLSPEQVNRNAQPPSPNPQVNEPEVDEERMEWEANQQVEEMRNRNRIDMEMEWPNQRHPITRTTTLILGLITLLYLICFEGYPRIFDEEHMEIKCTLGAMMNTIDGATKEYCKRYHSPSVEHITNFLLDMFLFFAFPVVGLLGLILSTLTLRFPTLLNNRDIEETACDAFLQLTQITLLYQTILLLTDSTRYMFHFEHYAFKPYDYMMSTMHFLFIFYMDMNYMNCIKLVYYNEIRAREQHQILYARRQRAAEEAAMAARALHPDP